MATDVSGPDIDVIWHCAAQLKTIRGRSPTDSDTAQLLSILNHLAESSVTNTALRKTGIGKEVNHCTLRRHSNIEIRTKSLSLVRRWRDMWRAVHAAQNRRCELTSFVQPCVDLDKAECSSPSSSADRGANAKCSVAPAHSKRQLSSNMSLDDANCRPSTPQRRAQSTVRSLSSPSKTRLPTIIASRRGSTMQKASRTSSQQLAMSPSSSFGTRRRSLPSRRCYAGVRLLQSLPPGNWICKCGQAHLPNAEACNKCGAPRQAQRDIGPPPRWVLELLANSDAGIVPTEGAAVVRKSVQPVQSTDAAQIGRFEEAIQHGTRELMPFQREGINFGIRHRGRVLIGDEMGLGKTVMGLGIAFEYIDCWPCLCIVPSSLCLQWRSQALAWFDGILGPDHIVLLSKGRSIIPADAKLVIVSYGLIAANERLRIRADGASYQVVIADESHYVKDVMAKRSRSVLRLMRQAEHVVLLSGTPAPNNPSELWAQLHALDRHNKMPSFREFAERYSNPLVRWHGRCRSEKWVGVRNENELAEVLKTRMIRRLKRDVLKDLPEKRRSRIVVEATDHIALRKLRKGLSCLQPGPIAAWEGVAEWAKLTMKAKLESTRQYVEHILGTTILRGDHKSKIILFAHHHEMLKSLEDTCHAVLGRSGLHFVRIDGRVSQAHRPELVRQFQEDPNVCVAILSMLACSEGLNLTSASLVLFCELYWVPGVIEQAEARAHRIGQENKFVDVQFLIVEGTIDERCWECLEVKQASIGAVLDNCRGMGAPKKRLLALECRGGAVHVSEERPAIRSRLAPQNEDEQRCTAFDFTASAGEPECGTATSCDHENVGVVVAAESCGPVQVRRRLRKKTAQPRS